jgi:hypothetical protein
MLTFSELAEAGLAKSTESGEQKIQLRHSIMLHVSHPDAWEKSWQLPVLDGRLYVYILWKVRITWEQVPQGDIMIWSITLLKAHRP